MTNKQKLEEIEAKIRNRSDTDVQWLISRVKQLEAALREIDIRTPSENSTVLPIACSIARKALEENE